jgi:DNA mismatch repair protein MutS
MHIDAATLQALEIRTAFRPGGLVSTGPAALSAKGTLLSTLSRTTTDAGARLLRRTLSSPSTHLPTINARLALVAAFAEREHLRADIRDALRPLADVARVLQRFRARSGEGADVWAVARWVRDVQRITEHVRAVIAAEPRVKEKGEQPEGVDRLVQLVDAFAPLNHLADGIEAAIDEASVNRLAAEDDEDGSLAAGDAMLEAKPKGKKAAVEAQLRKKEEAERQRWWIKPR